MARSERVERLAEFLEENEGILTTALRVYAERMDHAADEAGMGELANEPDRSQATPGTINIQPTRGGFARMSGVFRENSQKATKTADELSKLVNEE